MSIRSILSILPFLGFALAGQALASTPTTLDEVDAWLMPLAGKTYSLSGDDSRCRDITVVRRMAEGTSYTYDVNVGGQSRYLTNIYKIGKASLSSSEFSQKWAEYSGVILPHKTFEANNTVVKNGNGELIYISLRGTGGDIECGQR
jgi:hypothetical protein